MNTTQPSGQALLDTVQPSLSALGSWFSLYLQIRFANNHHSNVISQTHFQELFHANMKKVNNGFFTGYFHIRRARGLFDPHTGNSTLCRREPEKAGGMTTRGTHPSEWDVTPWLTAIFPPLSSTNP